MKIYKLTNNEHVCVCVCVLIKRGKEFFYYKKHVTIMSKHGNGHKTVM